MNAPPGPPKAEGLLHLNSPAQPPGTLSRNSCQEFSPDPFPKTAIAANRLLHSDAQGVTISWTDRQTGAQRTQKLLGHEFLRRFLQHVLPKGLTRVRHFGWLSPAAKKTYTAIKSTLEADPNRTVPPAPTPEASTTDPATPGSPTPEAPPKPHKHCCPNCHVEMQFTEYWPARLPPPAARRPHRKGPRMSTPPTIPGPPQLRCRTFAASRTTVPAWHEIPPPSAPNSPIKSPNAPPRLPDTHPPRPNTPATNALPQTKRDKRRDPQSFPLLRESPPPAVPSTPRA